MSEHLEIERKFDVAGSDRICRPGSLAGVSEVSPHRGGPAWTRPISTPTTLGLLRAGITLRRRTGGSDAGWHLKLPTGSGDRVEHGRSAATDGRGMARVPVALADLARAWARDRDLRPVAALQTSRTVHR